MNKLKYFLVLLITVSSTVLLGQIPNYTGTPTTSGCTNPKVIMSPDTHNVTFEGVIYDFPNSGQSTWLYKVVNSTAKKVKAISHSALPITLGCVDPATLNGELMAGKYTNNNGTYSFNMGEGTPTIINPDPFTGVIGLKFDENFDYQTIAYYFYVLSSKPDISTTIVGLKSANTTFTGTVCGPESYAEVPMYITGLDSHYETDDPAVSFTVEPSAATVSGPGISGLTFDPKVAGGGTHIIEIEYAQPGGCHIQNDTIQIHVDCTPKSLSITGVDTHYYMYDPIVALVGQPAGGTFSGPGVSGTTFKANEAGLGEHYIYYSYYDAPNCLFVDSTAKITVECCDVPIIVEGLPTFVDITGGKPQNFTPIILKAYPKGGDFITTSAGLTVIESKGDSAIAEFDPYVAGPGSHSIEYTLGDETCTVFDEVYVDDGEGNPLAVEIASFDVEAVDNTVKLSWTTSSETNNDFFTVEKSSDGKNFVMVTQMNGSGNSNQEINYFTYDNDPMNGVSYYSLKQTDFDGTSKTVGFAKIELNDEDIALDILKHSANNSTLNFEFVSAKRENISINIFTTTGQLIYSRELSDFNSTIKNFSVDLSPYDQGIYLLRLNNTRENVTLKFYLSK